MTSQATFLPFLSILFFLFSLSNGKFSNEKFKELQGSRKGSKVEGLHDLKLHLARFGYLNDENKDNHLNPASDEFDEELEAAVKSYQNFYHLRVTGTLDGPTISQMLIPRCGLPDIQITHHQDGLKGLHIVSQYAFFSTNPKWPVGKANLTYAFDLNNFPNAYIPPVVQALNTWSSASNYFTFSRATSIRDADLKVSFQKGNHGDGAPFESGNVLAHAFAPTDGRFHYNADDKWSVGPGPVLNANDLQTVALHEIGHLLGLAHSQNENAVMWPAIPTGTIKGLNSDDILGIKVLYGLI